MSLRIFRVSTTDIVELMLPPSRSLYLELASMLAKVAHTGNLAVSSDNTLRVFADTISQSCVQKNIMLVLLHLVS